MSVRSPKPVSKSFNLQLKYRSRSIRMPFELFRRFVRTNSNEKDQCHLKQPSGVKVCGDVYYFCFSVVHSERSKFDSLLRFVILYATGVCMTASQNK